MHQTSLEEPKHNGISKLNTLPFQLKLILRAKPANLINNAQRYNQLPEPHIPNHLLTPPNHLQIILHRINSPENIRQSIIPVLEGFCGLVQGVVEVAHFVTVQDLG